MKEFQIGVKAILIDSKNNVLLIKRSKKYVNMVDFWDIPGGRINFGEEPVDGLSREIKEETGLELDEVKDIVDASTIFKDEEKHIVRITYLATVKETATSISHEHTDFQWININEIKDLKDTLLQKCIDKIKINFKTKS